MVGGGVSSPFQGRGNVVFKVENPPSGENRTDRGTTAPGGGLEMSSLVIIYYKITHTPVC